MSKRHRYKALTCPVHDFFNTQDSWDTVDPMEVLILFINTETLEKFKIIPTLSARILYKYSRQNAMELNTECIINSKSPITPVAVKVLIKIKFL